MVLTKPYRLAVQRQAAISTVALRTMCWMQQSQQLWQRQVQLLCMQLRQQRRAILGLQEAAVQETRAWNGRSVCWTSCWVSSWLSKLLLRVHTANDVAMLLCPALLRAVWQQIVPVQ
jgi:hypothetical protein